MQECIQPIHFSMPAKTAPAPAARPVFEVTAQDVRDALNLHGAVLAYHADSGALLVIAPVSLLPFGYEVLATADQVHGYLLEYGSSAAAAHQLTAELRAELGAL